jgi:general secretion pathway protein H
VINRAARDARRGRNRGSAGITLVEVLITLAVIALLGGVAFLGIGVIESARLKRSAIMVAGAVRIAYAHANATGNTVRLVFDFEGRTVSLEESTSKLMLSKHGDRTGGAAAVTEAERAAQEEAESLLKGPAPPRPQFTPTKAFGFDPDEGKTGKELETGIRFLQVETGHQEDPETERAYLYFWPGGQTERAAIQLVRGRPGQEPAEDDIMTILVSPLTGKVELKKGKHEMERPRDDKEESEREDSGF